MKYSKIMNMLNSNDIVEPFIIDFEVTQNIYEITKLHNNIKNANILDAIMLNSIGDILEKKYDEVIDIFFKQRSGFTLSKNEQKLLACVQIQITRSIPLMALPTARLMMNNDNNKRNL